MAGPLYPQALNTVCGSKLSGEDFLMCTGGCTRSTHHSICGPGVPWAWSTVGLEHRGFKANPQEHTEVSEGLKTHLPVCHLFKKGHVVRGFELRDHN